MKRIICIALSFFLLGLCGIASAKVKEKKKKAADAIAPVNYTSEDAVTYEIQTIKKLVEKTSLDKATLTGIIDRLERDGFVCRVPSPDDKRATLILRTGKDEIFKKKVPKVSDEQNALFYKGFSKKEIEVFENYLKRVLQNCRDAEENI